jgi:hypothetical protein
VKELRVIVLPPILATHEVEPPKIKPLMPNRTKERAIKAKKILKNILPESFLNDFIFKKFY